MLRAQTWFRCDSSLGRWPRPDHEEPEYLVRRPQGKEVSQWKDWNKAPDLLPCHPPPCSSSGLSCLTRFLKVPPGDWQILKELSGQNQHQEPGPSKSRAAFPCSSCPIPRMWMGHSPENSHERKICAPMHSPHHSSSPTPRHRGRVQGEQMVSCHPLTTPSPTPTSP